MQTTYPKVVITDNMRHIVREVTAETKKEDLNFWKGMMVYHPATDQYYATWSKHPLEYFKTLQARVGPKWESVALVVRRMLDYHPDFQLFVLPINARPFVETWMSAGLRKKRVVTLRGEAATQEHILFEVYSHYSKFTRYVCAPSDTTSEEVIKKANEGMTRWLNSRSHRNKHERNTMQVALRARFGVKNDTIESTARVSRTNRFANVKHNQFSAEVTKLNLQAIHDFILGTVRGTGT